MITTRTPNTLQDLQDEVARTLSECGFAVKIEEKITTARGAVEIDVYAEESVQGRKYAMLCECKHWRTAVPQSVIHGFRTVVGDIGANKGYIISMSGFQSGSFLAAELTNIALVTWLEFQNTFESAWLHHYFAPELLKQLGGLMTYAEPQIPPWFDRLSDEDHDKFIALKEAHSELGCVAQYFAMHPYTRAKQPFPNSTLGYEHVRNV